MEKPYVICHMLTSLDGKIDGAYFNADECLPALKAYGELRPDFGCQATLYGTTTMQGGYSNGLSGTVPKSSIVYPQEDYIAEPDFGNYIISLDPDGILGWSSNIIEKKKRPKAHVIEVLTQKVSNDYLAYLRKFNISYIFAGEDRIDCSLLLRKLKNCFSIERLMIAGGGVTNWSFASEGLIDELSLVIAPVADGNTHSVSIFEAAGLSRQDSIATFRLKEARPLDGDVLWLRYLRKEM